MDKFYSRSNEATPNYLPKIEDLLGEKRNCPCGRIHNCNIKSVIIKKNALSEIPRLTENFNKILLVADENTYRVYGEKVDLAIGSKIYDRVILTSLGVVVPNEEAVKTLADALAEGTDLIIGVGSGVINDLCKHVSTLYSLPYYIVATAPSMDGYASKGAAMLFDGMKITTNAAPPMAIIADTDVLKDAPIEMIRAGYGDIIGKYSCLNDWRLSHLVNGEELCDFIYGLTYETVEAVAKMGEKIISRNEESIADLMRALVIVGVAMAYMGNSRPASGSEHHLSHYFEVTGLLREEPYLSHGIDVAYSTYMTSVMRKKLIEIDTPREKPFCEKKWQEEIHRVYGSDKTQKTASEIIALQKKLGWIYEDKLPTYQAKWEEIKEILKDAPSPEEVEELLSAADLHVEELLKTYQEDKLEDGAKYAKYLKDRYTVLWLYDQVF